jgi:hypothetical protein
MFFSDTISGWIEWAELSASMAASPAIEASPPAAIVTLRGREPLPGPKVRRALDAFRRDDLLTQLVNAGKRWEDAPQLQALQREGLVALHRHSYDWTLPEGTMLTTSCEVCGRAFTMDRRPPGLLQRVEWEPGVYLGVITCPPRDKHHRGCRRLTLARCDHATLVGGDWQQCDHLAVGRAEFCPEHKSRAVAEARRDGRRCCRWSLRDEPKRRSET